MFGLKTPQVARRTTPDIRFSTPRDTTRILEIEKASFVVPWNERNLAKFLRCWGNKIVVAEMCDTVAGYVMFHTKPGRLRLVNLAVAEEARHRGIARKLVDYCKFSCWRGPVSAIVSERNLDAQLFFRRMGFKATKILKARFGDQDAYRFTWRFRW